VASPSAPSASTDNVFIDTSGNLSVQKPDGNIVKIAAAGTYTLTIPATGTAALRDVAQTFSAAQTFSVNLTSPGIKPAADSTTAIRLFKADGTTAVLTVDTTNNKVLTAGDVFARADTYGLFDRTVNIGATPTDHFTAASLDGAWAWAASPYADAANSVVLASSLLRLVDNSITDDFFLYRSATSTVTARMCVGSNSYVGVRLDDGSATNSLEFRVQANAAGQNTLTVLRVTGGVAASSDIAVDAIAEWWVLRVLRSSSSGLSYLSKNTPILAYVDGVGGLAWTPSRAGITFGQRGVASSVDRAAYIDWVAIS